MNKKFTKQIETKLEKLQKLLDKFDEASHLNPDDPDTWDSDTLYGLAEKLKAALKILAGTKSKQRNQSGEPITLEPGLCSLVDDYQVAREEVEDA